MTQQDKSFQLAITRRRLLQGAAMGVVAANLMPDTLMAQPEQEEEIQVFIGTLSALQDGWLELWEQDHLRRVYLDEATTFWKGGEKSLAALVKDDEVMVKISTQQKLVLRAWANLSRVGGQVLDVKGNEYILETNSLHGDKTQLLLRADEKTTFKEYMTDTVIKGTRAISPGDSLDAIGEQTSDGLYATLVHHYIPDSSSPSKPEPENPESDTVKVNNAGCTYTYYGYAGWFNCSTGAGRCGTCNTSSSNQTAWPAQDSHCTCCNGSCCNCSSGCKNQVFVSCGKNINVTDRCQTRSRTVYVADCGPCQKANCSGCTPELCSRQTSDCLSYVSPVVDLTKPTFAYFYDPALRGSFSCSASVTLSICP